MKRNILILAFFITISFLFYKGLTNTFYQQDEWHTLGSIKVNGLGNITNGASVFDIITLSNRPLGRLTANFFLASFPFKLDPLMTYTLVLHAVNGFLLFLIIKRILKSSLFSILGSIFFLVNDTSKQAIIWASASLSTVPSGTGILLSILFYLFFLEKRKAKFAVLSIIFFVLSIGFKDTGIFLILFLPALDIIYQLHKKGKIVYKKLPLTIFLFGILLIVLKIINVFFLEPSFSGYASGDTSGVHRLIWSSITYPIETISQLFIPDSFFYPFSLRTTFNLFPYFEKVGYAVQVSEKLVLEILSILATFIFIVPVFVMTLFRKDKFPVFFFTLLYILSFLPFIVIVKSSAYLESRYYYTLLFPVVIFLAVAMKDFASIAKRYFPRAHSILLLSFFTLYFLLITFHVHFIRTQISFQKERALIRKSILSSIYSQKPKLEKKQIFYIESDHNFIAPNNPLPFQNGIGYTLLVLYAYKSGDDGLSPFLSNNFFWELGNEGYLEEKERGFGFFANIEKLDKEFKNKKFQKNDIVAFRYDSVENKIYNITDKIQKRL